MCFSYFFCKKLSPNAGLELNTTFIYNFAVLTLMGSRFFISANRASYWCGYGCRFPSRTRGCGVHLEQTYRAHGNLPMWCILQLWPLWVQLSLLHANAHDRVKQRAALMLVLKKKPTTWRFCKHIFDNIRINEININKSVRSTDKWITKT